MEIIVRICTEADLPGAAKLWNAVVEEGRAFPQAETLTGEDIQGFFDQQSYTGVAVDETGDVVGVYILHPNNVGRCGHLCNASYAVAEGLRGQHIGEKLVRDCMKRARELGFRILQFNAVVASNTPALKLYEKLGFVRLGRIPEGFLNIDGEYEDIIPHYITL
jgi:ribosomal protein S18 acetylase RimI-like enzyme